MNFNQYLFIKKPALLAGLSSLLLACSSPQASESTLADKSYCLDKVFKNKLEFVSPRKEQVVQGIHLTGSIDPNPDKVIHFVSLVGGVISNTYFSLGDEVKKGQVLAELRSTELSSMQSELSTITSQIRVAEKQLQAVQSMYEDKIASERDLLSAQSDLDILKAEREKVTSNLNLYSASAEKGVFQIKAPAAGIITAKAIAAGMQIAADSEPLFTISDLTEVWVMVNIYATNVQNIKPDMDVNISTLSYPEDVFKGKVKAISQVLDNEARVLKARVVLPNQDLKLKPGMLVDVIAMKELKREATVVPTKSLVFDNDQNYVVMYKSDCEIVALPVDVLTKTNGKTFLLTELVESEKIIAKNHLLIYEQLKNFQ